MSLLGIDVGTTGCKVIAFHEDGTVLAQAYGEYPLTHPQPGWSETGREWRLGKHSDWHPAGCITNKIRSDRGNQCRLTGRSRNPRIRQWTDFSKRDYHFRCAYDGYLRCFEATHNAFGGNANHRHADERYSYLSETHLDAAPPI